MSFAETGSVTVDRPRGEVWTQLITLAELASWYDGWDSCDHEPSEQRLRKGLIFRLRSHRIVRVSAECRVVTLDEPGLVRWVERRSMHAPVLVEFRLRAHTPRSTVITHTKTPGRLRRVPWPRGRQDCGR